MVGAGAGAAVAVVVVVGGGSDGDGAAESAPLAFVGGASEEAVVAVPTTDVGGAGLDAAAAAAAVTIPDGIATVGTETEVGVPALELPAEEEVVRLYKNAEKAVLPGA